MDVFYTPWFGKCFEAEGMGHTECVVRVRVKRLEATQRPLTRAQTQRATHTA